MKDGGFLASIRLLQLRSNLRRKPPFPESVVEKRGVGASNLPNPSMAEASTQADEAMASAVGSLFLQDGAQTLMFHHRNQMQS